MVIYIYNIFFYCFRKSPKDDLLTKYNNPQFLKCKRVVCMHLFSKILFISVVKYCIYHIHKLTDPTSSANTLAACTFVL